MNAIPQKIKRHFSDQDWAATPEPVQKDFVNLENWVVKLLEENQQLQDRLAELKAKTKKNSTNSSKPPSSDGPYRRPAKKTNKTPAAQSGAKPGHEGHRQELLEPTQTVPVLPEACACGGKEFEKIEPFYIHQEIELPEIKMQVTHFILNQGDCIACGETVKASLPAEHRTGYGPRLSALIGETAGIQGNSRTTIQVFCASVLKFHLSLGAIQKVIDRVAEAIQPIYEAIGQAARQSEINGIDETTWRKNGVLMYLWAMVNARVAFFMLHQRRSKEAFLALVQEWKGILISDGYRLYRSWINFRQTCLAHLIRDAKWLAEHFKPNIQGFGKKALAELQYLCSMAKEPPTEAQWEAFHARFIDLIYDHRDRRDEAGRFARRLERELDSLWVFLAVAGVEPTNNHTERSLRFGVLWRKRSQGTRSDKGDRWVERILSLRQTARLRQVSSFNILTEAMASYFKEQAPALDWIYLKNDK